MILSDAATIDHYKKEGVWGRATLDDIFRNTVKRTPDRLAAADPPNREAVSAGKPRRLTYAELDRAVERLARHLLSLGLAPGERIAAQLPNTVEQLVVLLAAARVGIIVSPLPLMWREYEIAGALPVIAPSAIISATNIVGRNHADMMRYAVLEVVSVRHVMAFGDTMPDGVQSLEWVFDDAELPEMERAAVDANALVTICWAGGNHPRPCPVPRSHNQWIAAGLMTLLEAHIKPGAVLLSPYPLAGLVPMSVFFVTWLLSGGTLLLHHPFDLDVFIDQINGSPADFTGLPPSVLDAVAAEAAFDDTSNLGALACLWPSPMLPADASRRGAGLAVPVIDIRHFGEMAYVARRRSDEAPPAPVVHGDWHAPDGAAGGALLLSTRVRGGAQLNGTQSSLLTGDLMIKSPMMFDAYYPSAAPDDDEPTIERDARGYANTGLRCRFVDATKPLLECVRRDNAVIYHGGISVSAAELDRLYAGHESLADVAAFPLDDPVMGERILAAVVPGPGKVVTRDDFADYLMDRKVAPYKVPDRVVQVKAIPRNEAGEVLRDHVLDQV